MRRSARFCLECPRWVIGARSLPESIQVAKFVMSKTRPERSRESSATIAATTRRSISFRSSSPITFIASQKRRWSSAPAPSRSQRSPAVLSHQSEKASLEHGSTTLLSAASAM